MCLRKWLLPVIIFFMSSQTYAQTNKINGHITTSPAGLPAGGATISVKNFPKKVFADSLGNFSINAKAGDVLTVTMVGYLSKDIPVTDNRFLKIVLAVNNLNLEDVVVIGYGRTNRRDVTGSISSVSGNELRRTHPVTFDQALQGKVPGLVTQQISGQPGGAVSVQIRGISSFGGGAPMYVIDGIIIGGTATQGAGTNPLAGINPSDIESIDVLKDASATAIYGSQATNGVIVITTKRGSIAPPSISFDLNSGLQQLPGKLPVMNLREYATFINERNTGIGWGFDNRPEFVNPQYLGTGTDWQDELFRSAAMSNANLTVNGGDAKTQYLLAGGYFSQQGIALGSKFDRLSLRLNLDNKTTNWLKIGTSLQLIHIKENINTTSSNIINTALSQTADIPVKNSDGSWGGALNPNGWVNSTVNPYALALINTDEVKRKQMFGNVYAEINFTRNLILRNEITANYSMATEDIFLPTYQFGLVRRTVNSGTYNFSQSIFSTLRKIK